MIDDMFHPMERVHASNSTLGTHGGRRIKGQAANGNSPKAGSNSRPYTIARLRRDGFHRLADQVERGELSAREARLAAGYKTAKREAKSKNIKAAARERKRTVATLVAQIRAEPPPLPSGPFRVLVIDPPWPYRDDGDGRGRARADYPLMTMEDIAALPVATLATADAVLWLWTTQRHLERSYPLVRGWGFEPRRTIPWVKRRWGLGVWLRNQVEFCILAVRGKPLVTPSGADSDVLQDCEVRQHSRKPDEFFDLVGRLCPGSKLELFSREPRPGWTVWGAESAKFADGARGAESAKFADGARGADGARRAAFVDGAPVAPVAPWSNHPSPEPRARKPAPQDQSQAQFEPRSARFGRQFKPRAADRASAGPQE